MATYKQISDIANNNILLDQMSVAVAIHADVIRQEAGSVANHANRLIWAKATFSDPVAMASKMQWAVLAQNASATDAQIRAATDATILTAIAAAVDIFATGA